MSRLDLLILGGTAWLGRLLAQAAVEAGHRVTCAARGRSGDPPAGSRFWRLDRDQSEAWAALAAERFDALVELGSQPGRVREAAQALQARCHRCLYVSSVSVYAPDGPAGQDESAPLLPALTAAAWTSAADYGAAKVACEAEVMRHFGPDRAFIVRPGLIGGPGDVSDRSGYWPWRFHRAAADGAPVLAPDVPQLPTQVIDARDLAAWMLHGLQTGLAGTFNAVGPSVSLAEHLATARAVAGHTGPVQWCDPAWLEAQGVNCWAGPRSLPLWVPWPSHAGFGTRSHAAARAAGLRCRPLADTLADTLDWELGRPPPQPRRAGLGDADEAHLLAADAARGAR